MEALLSMPAPMSTALMVLMAIAAFFFVKLVALVFAPSYSRYVLVESKRIGSARPQGRRASDRQSNRNAVVG